MIKFNKMISGGLVPLKPPKYLADKIPDRPKEPIKPELPYTKKVDFEFKVGEDEYKLSSLLKGLEGKDVIISAYEKGLDEGLVQFICLSYIEEIEVSEEDKILHEKEMAIYNKEMASYHKKMEEYNLEYKDIHNTIICYQIGLLYKKINDLKDEIIK